MHAVCRVVHPYLVSSSLEKDEDFLASLGGGCKSSIHSPLFLKIFFSIRFREIVNPLLSIKNMLYEAKLRRNVFLICQLLS